MASLTSIFGEIGVSQMIFMAGLALLAVMLLVRSRRHFRQVSDYQIPRSDTPLPSQSKQRSAGAPLTHAAIPPRDFEKWEVAMHDLARDVSGQLDSKIRILEILIRDAEKASARLEAAVARSRGLVEPIRESPPTPQSTEKKTDQMPVAAAASAAMKRAETSPATSNDQPRFDRIYALADAGLSPTKIANQIGSQIGEVELILGIRGEGRGMRD